MKLYFNSDEYIDINVGRNGTVGIPYDCELEIKLVSEASSGNNEIWVDGIELQGFIAELEALDNTLKGSAVLTSESPGELHIEIKQVDNLGHFVFVATVGRKFYIQSKVCEATATNAFPLDSEGVSRVCKKIIKYFNEQFNA